MCDCFDRIESKISLENEQNGELAKVWSFKEIKFTFRKFTKNNEYSSRLGTIKYKLKYCPFCGQKME
ncbi:hypothetical protein [Clostridium sp.]|uniref:hypothetical protein n=1 Tax=Clostridium sp. TaxID=1506 RepID=UPI0029070763|nr:hypothetical protein [Clostridium sp.]MDU3410042.1 hypothetical protein [Clostridium sp.]